MACQVQQNKRNKDKTVLSENAKSIYVEWNVTAFVIFINELKHLSPSLIKWLQTVFLVFISYFDVVDMNYLCNVIHPYYVFLS